MKSGAGVVTHVQQIATARSTGPTVKAWKLLGRRLRDALLAVWAVGTLAFFLLHFAPGDPLTASLTDPRIAPSVRAQWREQLGVDRPVLQQYVRHVGALGRGDLGYSWSRQRPVQAVLREALPHSLFLVGMSLALATLMGVALGTWQALRWGSRTERVVSTLQGLLAGVPDSWLALMLLGLLGAQWGMFPLNGRCDPATCGRLTGWAGVVDVAHHAALPIATLTLLVLVPLARLQRVAVDAVLFDDAVRTAVAKGVPTMRLLRRHVLRRAARPVIVALSLGLPAVVGGAVVVERIFGWPGMGAVLVDAVATRDYPLVTACAALSAVMMSAGALLADLAVHRLDPRVHAEGVT